MKLRPSLLVTTLLFASRIAAADPTTADGWYTEGSTQYTLGNFDKAVTAFKKGFELETDDSKKPAYLYNIAQAYRQANDCKNAVFFYKRFLALKDNDTVKPLSADRRTEVEGRIKDGEDCIKSQDALRTKPPDTTIKPGDDDKSHKPDATRPAEPTRVAAHDDTGGSVTAKPPPGETPGLVAAAPGTPHLISLRLVGGGTKVSAGNLEFPVLGTGALIGGYPLAFGDKLTLELGAAFTFTQVGFDNMQSGATESAKMFDVLANAGARYAVAPKIGVRGDLGLGVLVFSGLDNAGNPFTAGAQGTTGALSMFRVRAAASVDYLITENLAATLTPIAFGYSPAKAGLRDDITSITSIDFMLGLGYRM